MMIGYDEYYQILRNELYPESQDDLDRLWKEYWRMNGVGTCGLDDMILSEDLIDEIEQVHDSVDWSSKVELFISITLGGLIPQWSYEFTGERNDEM